MSNWGRETVVFLEIDQPLCTLQFGELPCTAKVGVTGTHKCFNGRFTCHDVPNYSPETLTLRFCMDQLDLLQYGNVIPSLLGHNTTPMAINLGGMDENLSAFGQRESCTVDLVDHKYDDHLVDKYRLERAFVPGAYTQTFEPEMFRQPGSAPAVARREFFGHFEASLQPYERGTFWGKWLARNPFHQGYSARIRMGFLGDALEDMRVRHYVIDRIEGPTDGQVRVVLKDLFTLVEAKKAVAPLASQGELSATINDVVTSATLSPAGIGNAEYPASGHVAIGDEIMAFTRSGDALTLTRAQLNTTATEHDEEDLVQLVLSYSAQLAHDIIYDLLTVYGGIDPAQIDKPRWDALAAELDELYTTRITTPTPVNQLVGELMLQAGCTVLPNVSTGMVDFAALQAGVVSPTVDDQGWIADDKTLGLKRQDEKRVTEVWVYYGQIRPNEDLEDPRNFRSRSVTTLEENKYESPVIRVIYSRFIPQFGRQSAERCGERLLAMFEHPPLEATIPLHASRDGELQLAQYFGLRTADVQDDVGAQKTVTMSPVEIESGEVDLTVRAQQVTLQTLEVVGERVIPIENDSYNLNLRAIHDSIFTAPTGSEVIRFVVLEGVTVGSTSPGSPGIRTGIWPTMATLPRLSFAVPDAGTKGRVTGCGGKAGAGGNASNGPSSGRLGAPGGKGGPALRAEAFFEVDNLNGQLHGGGGGGGGGGGAGGFAAGGGGGGGGGAGVNGGAPGSGGAGHNGGNAGSSGSTGGGTTGGPGGGGGSAAHVGGPNGGAGGAGGNSGQVGSAGSTSAGLDPAAGGAGSAIGDYIQGNSFVTWINTGDVLGGVA